MSSKSSPTHGMTEAPVEGGSSPCGHGCLKPEGVWEQRPVRHAHITEKPLDPVEECGQPFRIEPRRKVASGEARAQFVIVLPLDRSFRCRSLRQDAEIISIHEGHCREAQHHYPQESRANWSFGQHFPHASAEQAKRIVEGLLGGDATKLIGHVRPPAAVEKRQALQRWER